MIYGLPLRVYTFRFEVVFCGSKSRVMITLIKSVVYSCIHFTHEKMQLTAFCAGMRIRFWLKNRIRGSVPQAKGGFLRSIE